MKIKVTVFLVILIAILASAFCYFSKGQESDEIKKVIAITKINAGHGESPETKKATEDLKENFHNVNLLKKIAKEKSIERKELEIIFEKAKVNWDIKMSNFIISELKLGEDVFKKYQDIQTDFNENQDLLLKGQNDDIQYEKRLEDFTENVRKIFSKESGFDLEKENVNPSKDLSPLYKAMAKALDQDEKKFLDEHLLEVKNLLGPVGFKKYQKIKSEFNLKITKNASKNLIKI